MTQLSKSEVKQDVKSDTTTEQLKQLELVLENAQTAIMFIDSDFVITYANKKTHEIIDSYKEQLSGLYPQTDFSSLVGVCIDDFHKNPSHQRSLLSNPANLPYKTDIKVGPLIFLIHVDKRVDSNNKIIGYTLEWSDVTKIRKKEDEVFRLENAVHGAQTAMMMVDRNRIITSLNKATIALLTKHQTKLASVYPNFSIDNMMGACIDMFHKNPPHQAQFLDNPNNFPYKTDIKIADLIFELHVSAVLDSEGHYIGNILEWSDVTDLRIKETEIFRLQNAVLNAQTPMMMINLDRVITYANAATINLLRKHEMKLRQLYPSLSIDNLIGTCIDIFHKNPQHQAGILSIPTNMPYNSIIKVGDLYFEINVNAMYDAEGVHTGNSLEWQDVTEETKAQEQIEHMIANASAGELSARIDTASFSGFMKTIADSINQLLENIVVPLQGVAEVMNHLSNGNLNEYMHGDYHGEFATLSDSVNSSIQNLEKMVNEVMASISSVANSSADIANGNEDLSSRTEKQAAALEEVASSVEQLTSTIRSNTENARNANELATSAHEEANTGGTVVEKAVDAMEKINESSNKISDIIVVIDEIAFQTNLLALNAAVEAARAGEQGRGFAVVAAEVRNLAQRSAEAAKEIKALINDSVSKVSEGSKLVIESGKALDEIVKAINNVNTVVSEISIASEEQYRGVEEINSAISSLDDMTQENAAMVEEATAASRSLDEQAAALSDLMSFFDAGDGSQKIEPAAKPKPRHSSAAIRSRRIEPSRPPMPMNGNGSSNRASSGDEWDEF